MAVQRVRGADAGSRSSQWHGGSGFGRAVPAVLANGSWARTGSPTSPTPLETSIARGAAPGTRGAGDTCQRQESGVRALPWRSTGATVEEYGCYRERVRRLPGDGTVRRVWKDSSAGEAAVERSRSGRPSPGRRRGASLTFARETEAERSREPKLAFLQCRGVRRRRSAVGGDAQVARDGRWCIYIETER